MTVYNGPARGGSRGGKDQFQWDNVKEDKYMQNYLGHSAMAPVGRWQKGKDLNWYSKGSKVDLEQAEIMERKAIKEREKDLMAQMLGEKPMVQPKGDLDRLEKNKLFKKGDAEEGTVAECIAKDTFGERIQGLGFAPIKVDDLRQEMDITTSEKLEGIGINELIAQHASGQDHGGAHDHGKEHNHAAMLAAIMGMGSPRGRGHDDGEDASDKKSKKKLKKLHKQEKKMRKEAKKTAKKEAKHKSRRDSSNSESPSPSRGNRNAAASFFKQENERHVDRVRSRSRSGGRTGRDKEVDSRRDRRDRSRERSRDRSRDRSRERDRSGQKDWDKRQDRDARDRNRDRDTDRDARGRSRSRSGGREGHRRGK